MFPFLPHSALLTESEDSKHVVFLRYIGKKLGEIWRLLCLLSPLPAPFSSPQPPIFKRSKPPPPNTVNEMLIYHQQI